LRERPFIQWAESYMGGTTGRKVTVKGKMKAKKKK